MSVFNACFKESRWSDDERLGIAFDALLPGKLPSPRPRLASKLC